MEGLQEAINHYQQDKGEDSVVKPMQVNDDFEGCDHGWG